MPEPGFGWSGTCSTHHADTRPVERICCEDLAEHDCVITGVRLGDYLISCCAN
jgi:hypothetical protein